MSDELSEIWTLYADDGGQSLDTVEEMLGLLKDNPSDEASIAALFRAMHTFKGNSRVLGLSVIESRAHLAEDLIGLVRDEGVPLDGEMHALLLEVGDALRAMMEQTLASRRDAEEAATADLAERMRNKARRCKAGEKPDDAPPLPAILEAPAGLDSDAGSEPEVPHATEPAAAPEAIIFEAQPRRRLADDPTYQEIFLGLAQDVIRQMRDVLDRFDANPDDARTALVTEAERLNYAADQIRMRNWPQAVAEFLAEALTSRVSAETAIERLEAMYGRDMARLKAVLACAGGSAAASDSAAQFFVALDPLLGDLAAFGTRLAAGEQVDADDMGELAAGLRTLAESSGFVRVADIAMRFADAGLQADAFRRLQFLFYEELASIEEATGSCSAECPIQPTAILRAWCADHVLETLRELDECIDALKRHESLAENCENINELMRRIYHCCHHYELPTAARLAMALTDLLARAQTADSGVDPVLVHILKSFLDALELVFDTVSAGQVPDQAAIEKLLEEASNVAFITSGTMTSAAIEARLGLPKSFHKVLTPESVQVAMAALDAREHFYIIRADLNENEELGQRFFEWIGDGAATVISNVTVFEIGTTLFDFLVSSRLDEAGMAESLAGMDPQGMILKVRATLVDRQAGDAGNAASVAEDTGSEGMVAQDAMPADMLEAIGEIVTGQAMAHHMLSNLAEEDFVHAVESLIRTAGGDWSSARSAVRQYLLDLQEKVERLAQAEAQVAGRLDRLQEEAIAVRTRPAALLLKPLVPFGETLARQHGRQLTMTISGEELSLDSSTLEHLKGPIRSLLTFCVAESIAPAENRVAAGKNGVAHIHVALIRHEDHLVVTIDDDGIGIDLGQVAERARQKGWEDEKPSAGMVLREGFGRIVKPGTSGGGTDLSQVLEGLRPYGGDLHVANRPNGGTSFRLTMPLAMVVMDGMVVRVGEVMYVVSIDAIQRIVHSGVDALMKVSAEDGHYMLRLGGDDVLPVQFLMRSGHTEEDPAQGFAVTDAVAGTGEGQQQKRLFVVAGKDSRKVALSVDELIGQQLVLIRPLQGFLSGIRGVTGCALLGSGEVGMVLDIGAILTQS